MKRKRAPKPWRKKNASGRYVGNYFISSGGEINLGTSDANEADLRMRDHVRTGRRNFVDEIDEAAAASEGGEAETPAPPPAAAPTAPAASPAAAPVAPPAAAPTAPAAPAASLQPDAVFSPFGAPLQLPPVSDSSPRAEAEATNEAAADGDAGDDQADAGAGAAVPPDIIDAFLEQGAGVIVDLQLELQATLIRKRAKREPARIPDDSPVRKMAAAAWVAQLKIWIPPDKMLPPWALALILPAMCFPQQYASSVPIKDDKQPDAAAGAAPEAAAAAA